MIEIFKSYPINNNYEVGNNGTIKYKGTTVRKGLKGKPILVNLVSTEIVEMVNTCFKDAGTTYKLSTKPHHRKGVRHTKETKQKITDSKLKKVVINGKTYKGVSTASKQLGVNRSTIFRYMREDRT